MQTLINEFENGGAKLLKAIEGLSKGDLVAHPIAGTWSIQEIVIHMQDSDAVAIDRMKRIISEDKPLLIGFDETRYITELFTDEQSAADAALLFDLSRKQFVRVLRRLPAAAFERAGIHNERGKVTLGDLMKIYTNHLDHHLKFLNEKRAKLGK